MLCITGDLHGDMKRFSLPKVKKLGKGDYLIICGDFGCIWDGGEEEKKLLSTLGSMKYDVLFVDGTHDNHALLNKYPEEEWNGGRTRVVSGKLRLLMRGQVYNLGGKTVYAFGGGQREDNDFTPGEEYDMLEIPTAGEMREGRSNLAVRENKVDYIVTYEPPARITEFLAIGLTDRNTANTYFDEIAAEIEFKRWFFGRHHQNKLIPPKYQAAFDDAFYAE